MPCQDFYCSYAEGYGGVGQCRGKAMKLRKSSLNGPEMNRERGGGRRKATNRRIRTAETDRQNNGLKKGRHVLRVNMR